MQRISSFTSDKTAQVVESVINDSAYDVVKIVSDNITQVTAISTAIGDGTFTNVDTVATEPFKSNIDNALTNATNSANSATNAQLSEWEAEASRLTATSYAVEAENVLVNLVTSNGDGTYTYTPQTGVYSSLHYQSTSTVTVFDPALYQTRSEEGVANGYASLDNTGLVPASQLPSYVDAVVEVATYADLPLGTTGVIYIVVADETKGGDTSTYRWTGSVYALVSNTLTSLDVKNLYEGNTDTNVYTDAEKAQVVTNTSDIVVLGSRVTSHDVAIAVVKEAIGNLADAQGTINSDVPITIGLTETQLSFDIGTDSTDTDVFSLDAVANTITLKKPGSYNFTSSGTLESSTNHSVDITLTLRNVADEAIVTTQLLHAELSHGDKAIYPLNTLVVVAEGAEPLTIKVMANADLTGMTLFAFDSLLASMSANASGFTDHSQLTGTMDVDSHPSTAISYDATSSGMSATNVQGAMDELEGRVDTSEGKLAGIETNATADQNGSEIKSLYEAESDTNAYTDSEKTKLGNTEVTSQLNARDTANRDADNHTDGTTNGVYTLAERARLLAIEDSATADQTASEIETLYEGIADTNKYTDVNAATVSKVNNTAVTSITFNADGTMTVVIP